ncbi:hypothetical protein GCM10023149_37830 [Mucilaginibacter gynuensis]|uniref:Uncharacterized protein n=1 Tax=Mucilaginibacter gynuensis TaxID=1302236 RepID=A0ABP8GYI6_9SPHI
MWKKIRSNRDPKYTLLSELAKELKPWIDPVKKWLVKKIHNHPKPLFFAMAISLGLSLLLSFTVFRQINNEASLTRQNEPRYVKPGLDSVVTIAEQLQQVLALREMVERLIAKKKLSSKDSLQLDSALNRLQDSHSTQ